MRQSEARGLRGAHVCRRRARAEEVSSRSVAEEPTMFSSRESENGSPGHDALVRPARGVQGGESRAPTAPWRVSGPRDIIHRCIANSELAGGCVAANFWRPQLSRRPFRLDERKGQSLLSGAFTGGDANAAAVRVCELNMPASGCLIGASRRPPRARARRRRAP